MRSVRHGRTCGHAFGRLASAMADGLRIDLRGDERLLAALEDIGDELDVEESDAVKDTLDDEVVPAIKDRTPTLTGELRRSIERRGVKVSTDKVYAPVIEFAERGRWSGLTAEYGKPPRYFFAELEEHADDIMDSIGDAVERRWG